MSRFDTTRWSLVLQARGDAPRARMALETLCRAYRPAAIAYVRHRGYAKDDADDLVQAFFLRFIDQSWHAGADRERGRFRTYLLTMLKRHLGASEVEANALKRGGGVRIDPIDVAAANDTRDDDDPERHFERTWATTVLARAFARMREEAGQAGKLELFETLREFMLEPPDKADYARAAEKLGLRRNALAVAVHRMRHRLRVLIEAELADTAASAADLEEELQDLRGALQWDEDAARSRDRGNHKS